MRLERKDFIYLALLFGFGIFVIFLHFATSYHPTFYGKCGYYDDHSGPAALMLLPLILSYEILWSNRFKYNSKFRSLKNPKLYKVQGQAFVRFFIYIVMMISIEEISNHEENFIQIYYGLILAYSAYYLLNHSSFLLNDDNLIESKIFKHIVIDLKNRDQFKFKNKFIFSKVKIGSERRTYLGRIASVPKK